MPFTNFCSENQWILKPHHCILCCCSCLQPQRVSILKNKQKAGPNIGKLIGRQKLDMKNLVVTWWNRCHISTQYWYNQWLLLKFKHWFFVECMFLCSFSRFHKVRTIFSRSRCSAKHPAEWGSEGWGVSRSHPQKCHSSFGQRHFSLHRMYLLNSFWLTFAVSTWTMVLFWWMRSQAQRVPARKQQVDATRATAGKDAKTHLTYIKTWIFIFPDVRMLFLILQEEPVGMKWTPQRVPNTRHQPMSAMVCRFVLCMSADCLILLVAFLKWLPAALFRNGICRRSPLRTAWRQGCEAANQTECHTRRWEETSHFCYMSLTRMRRKHWSGLTHLE